MTNSKPESGHPDENKQDTKKRKQEKGVPFRNANAERQREEDARKAYITRDGKPPPVTEEVKRLRDLPAADYEQRRKEAAADLGIRRNGQASPAPACFCRNRTLGRNLSMATIS